MMSEDEAGPAFLWRDLPAEKSSHDGEVLVFICSLFEGESVGVGLGGCSRRELVNASFVVDAVILPVTVAANDDDFVFSAELAKLVAFMAPVGIGVIVALVESKKGSTFNSQLDLWPSE